jgi:hypothetical protein
LKTFAELLCFELGKCSFGKRRKSQGAMCQCGTAVVPFLGQKFLHIQSRESRSIVMHKPISSAPLLGSFLSHILLRTPQNIRTEILVHSFTFGNEFVTHDSVNVNKKTRVNILFILKRVYHSSGAEMVGPSIEKSVALFLGRILVPIFALKGRRFDGIITI